MTVKCAIADQFRCYLDEQDIKPDVSTHREKMHDNPHHCQHEEFAEVSGEFEIQLDPDVWDEIQDDFGPDIREMQTEFEWTKDGVTWDCLAEYEQKPPTLERMGGDIILSGEVIQ